MCICMGLCPPTHSLSAHLRLTNYALPLTLSGAKGGSEKRLINGHGAGAGQSQQRPVYLTATWVRGWLCLVYACTQIVTELAICVSLTHLHRCPWGGGVVSQLSGHWNAESMKDTEVPSLPGVTRLATLSGGGKDCVAFQGPSRLGFTQAKVHALGLGCGLIVKQCLVCAWPWLVPSPAPSKC